MTDYHKKYLKYKLKYTNYNKSLKGGYLPYISGGNNTPDSFSKNLIELLRIYCRTPGTVGFIQDQEIDDCILGRMLLNYQINPSFIIYATCNDKDYVKFRDHSGDFTLKDLKNKVWTNMDLPETHEIFMGDFGGKNSDETWKEDNMRNNIKEYRDVDPNIPHTLMITDEAVINTPQLCEQVRGKRYINIEQVPGFQEWLSTEPLKIDDQQFKVVILSSPSGGIITKIADKLQRGQRLLILFYSGNYNLNSMNTKNELLQLREKVFIIDCSRAIILQELDGLESEGQRNPSKYFSQSELLLDNHFWAEFGENGGKKHKLYEPIKKFKTYFNLSNLILPSVRLFENNVPDLDPRKWGPKKNGEDNNQQYDRIFNEDLDKWINLTKEDLYDLIPDTIWGRRPNFRKNFLGRKEIRDGINGSNLWRQGPIADNLLMWLFIVPTEDLVIKTGKWVVVGNNSDIEEINDISKLTGFRWSIKLDKLPRSEIDLGDLYQQQSQEYKDILKL